MITQLLKIVPFVLSKLGVTESVKTSGKKPSYIYMKRTIFYMGVFFALWAFIDPDGLSIRLTRVYDVMPDWFISLLATIFGGIWI